MPHDQVAKFFLQSTVCVSRISKAKYWGGGGGERKTGRKKINSRNRGGGVGEVMEPRSAQYQRASVTLLVYLLISTCMLVTWTNRTQIHTCDRVWEKGTYASFGSEDDLQLLQMVAEGSRYESASFCVAARAYSDPESRLINYARTQQRAKQRKMLGLGHN